MSVTAARAAIESTVDFYRHDRTIPYGAFERAWWHLPRAVRHGNGHAELQNLFRDAFTASSDSEPSLHLAKQILLALQRLEQKG
jgi:hypothetical protein